MKSSEYLNSVKAEQFTDELLDMKDAPTCIFYPDDLSNTGGLNAVRKRGLKVPRDISTVGYDGIKLSQPETYQTAAGYDGDRKEGSQRTDSGDLTSEDDTGKKSYS